MAFAISSYLRDDVEWLQATDRERRQKVRALARRLQRSAKKTAT